jgi:lipoprotein-releasing system permease protein
VTHYEFFIGWRYLRAKPFQTAMSITGVVLGVVVLIVTYSVWSGLEEELRGSLLGSEAHLVVDRAGEGFAGYEEFIAQVLTIPGVVAASPTVESEALLQSPTSSQRRAGAMIRGVDPARAGDVVNVDEYLGSGELRFDRDDLIESGRRRLAEGDTVKGGIILGSGLARRLGVRVGDPVVMYAAFHQIGGQFVPVVRNFVVIDTYESGLYEIDSGVAYIDFDVAQDVFSTNGRASRVHVGIEDPDNAAQVKEDILARHGLLYVPRTWQEMRGEFFFWLRVEKIGAMVMLGAIVLVAGFSIAIALVMLVREKTREIGILRAMGARAQTVRSIFVLHGAVVGATGIVLGTGVGLLVCGAVALYEIPLPGSVYQIEHVPVTLSWRFIALVDALTLAMCLVMAWVPAKRAADMHPVEALRYE